MIAPDYADTPEHLREELADAQGALLDILRDLGLDACPVAEARGAVGRAVQAIREERDAEVVAVVETLPAPLTSGCSIRHDALRALQSGKEEAP